MRGGSGRCDSCAVDVIALAWQLTGRSQSVLEGGECVSSRHALVGPQIIYIEDLMMNRLTVEDLYC